MDQRDANLAQGAVEQALLNAATAQIARFYGIPSRGAGATTDSKMIDFQAGSETSMTAYLAALAGVNYIIYSVGSLESSLTMSYEKCVIDNEMLGGIKRVLKGIGVNKATLAVDVIGKVGPGGHYLSEKHTREFLEKEHYLVEVTDRSMRDAWEKRGAKEVREKARDKAKKILESHEPTPLDKDIQRELRMIVEEVKKRELK